MALTISSEFTFSIPADITKGNPGLMTPASLKRISANGVTPVVLEGININTYEIQKYHYISYDDGTGRQNRRIKTVELLETGNYKITLQNPRGEHWDTFPTTNTTSVQWVKDDNFRMVNDYKAQFYYWIEQRNVENLVFDVEFEQEGTENLKMEMATFKRPVTKEEIRFGNIFDDDLYINDAKDVDTNITQKIYTLKPVSGNSFKYRIPMDLLLTDQIVRITLYPSDYNDGPPPTGSNSTIKLDVHVNSLGYRYDMKIRNREV